jgi:hypothetical protein
MTWDGVERRNEVGIQTDIAVIKEQISQVKSLLEETRSTQLENSPKLASMDSLKEDFKSHVIADRWFFGLILTTVIGIFIKLVVN